MAEDLRKGEREDVCLCLLNKIGVSLNIIGLLTLKSYICRKVSRTLKENVNNLYVRDRL